ncbi:MAG: hypothetical protein GY705_24455 [Bacteroidetes bacterium]|nr:hypothetical protein [Bacteroidota bacterium]
MQKYVPLKNIPTHLEQHSICPYNSKVNLLPLLESWKSHLSEIRVENGATLSPFLEKLDALFDEAKQEMSDVKSEYKDFSHLASVMFHSFLSTNQLGFIAVPLHKRFIYQTPQIKDLFFSDNWEIDPQQFEAKKTMHLDIVKPGSMILNTFYDQSIHNYFSDLMTVRHCETKLEKHFRFNIHLDFIKIIPLRPVKKLSQQKIHQLINNPQDTELWLESLPPENFNFEGVAIGNLSDVTEVEIISRFKEILAENNGQCDHFSDLEHLAQLTASFLQNPDLKLGVLVTEPSPFQSDSDWSLLRSFDPEIMIPTFKDQAGSYGSLLKTGQAVLVDDLQEQKHLSKLEKVLLEKGFRSLLLAPLYNNDGKIVSFFELASPSPFSFNRFTLYKLKEIINFFSVGAQKFLEQIDNSVNTVIQSQFTSIHPAVEWKFNEVASEYYWDRMVQNEKVDMAPVIFEDLYPLYGQSDIVGSSDLRNESIVADLIDNLTKLKKVLSESLNVLSFDLLEVYLFKVEEHLQRLQDGQFVSSDETHIVNLLVREIHPLLRQLKNRYAQLPATLLDEYFGVLDSELDIIYHQRKAYEDSVSQLSSAISLFIEEQDEKMQEILPHYFEKYKTDGVEYNIYLGQSILKEGTFSQAYLKNFRLWQLINMCEITRLVEQQATQLPIPLKTAQLIFVYNNFLSISFRMDEKQFDVDGAYNVRYKILKKRIDKAIVKSTGERLTVHRKIAIVWLQENDRLEYLEYIHHLIKKGYVKEEIEELELEKLQGAEGLKALRVEVVMSK